MISNELLKKKILDEAILGRLVENDLTLPPINVKQSIYNKNISVPKNWVITTIGLSGLEFTNGNYSSQYPKAEEFVDYGIPFIRANNLQNDTIVSSGMYYITPEKHEYLSKGHLKTNDIIVAIRGSIGLCSIVPQEYDNANLNAQLTVLRSTTNNINSKFLLYEIKSNFIQKQFEQYITGSALKQLSEKNMRKCFLVLPPIKEQERIAKKIEELFELVDKKDKNDKEKEKLKTLLKEKILDSAIHGELVENDLSLPAVDVKSISDVPFNIPSNWKYTKIEYCVTLTSGVTLSEELKSGDILYVKVSDMNLPENKKEIITSSRYQLRKNIKNIVPVGSIIFPKRGGAIKTNKKKLVLRESICVDLNTMAMTPNAGLDIMYLYYWFMQIDLGNLCNGTSVPQINNKDLNPLKILIPPLEQQKKIVEKIEECFKLIEQL